MARHRMVVMVVGMAVAASCGLAPRVAAGQVPAPLRAPAASAARDTLKTARLTAYRDTLAGFETPYRVRPFVQPGSERIYVNGACVEAEAYRFDYRAGVFTMRDPRRVRVRDTVVVAYQTWRLGLRGVYQRRRMASARPRTPYERRLTPTPAATLADSAGADTSGIMLVEEVEAGDGRGARDGFDPFEGVTLERSGSVSRGLIGGNRRDTNVESGLRLQLQGALAEDIDVRAVLTDQNTPLQPQGTTQRLQEFDRVFIEMDTPQGTAQLGDIDVGFGGTEFARFQRRLQGASVRSQTLGALVPGGVVDSARVHVFGAVPRGLFQTQTIQPLDGVQGPYRLEGANGETFIVVVAGSERVFLDGERLVRGETNDYVVDYARGELRFTPNRIVTADRRIQVEFEYTTTQFNRTLVGTNARVGLWRAQATGRPRLSVGAVLLREADERNFAGPLELSPADSLRLVASGDAGVFQSGAEVVRFDPEAPYVQYRREVQPLPGGGADTAFVALDAAPEAGVRVFRVRFTRVGAGQGRYVRGARRVNGIAYAYRGPGLGDYEPVLRIPQPIQRRLLDLHAAAEPLPGLRLFGEWAQSLNDQNRLSPRDAFDDRGEAYRAGVRLEALPIEAGATTLGTLSAEVTRQQRGRYFVTFNRTRAVEFGRRWNLDRPVSPSGGLATGGSSGAASAGGPAVGDETVDEAALAFALTPRAQVGASVGRLDLGPVFRAWRRQATVRLAEPGLPRVDYRAELITSDDRTQQAAASGGGLGTDGDAFEGPAIDGRWWRQLGTVRQPLLGGRLTPQVQVEHERRRQRVAGADSLDRASQSFVEVRPSLAYAAGDLTARAEVEYRTADAWADGVVRPSATAWTTQAEAAYRPGRSYDARAKVGYRVRRFTEVFRLEEQRQGDESILVQWEAGARPFDRAVDVRGFYDVLTERTPTLQEVFVRVGPELGQFVWVDANGDGLVQVDEFVPETTPNEGEYIQSFVPSDSLANVISLQTRLRLRLDPAQRWRRATARWKRWLAQVTTETRVEVREQNRTDDLAAVYLLDLRQFRRPGATVDGQLQLGQDVFLFRRATRFGLDLGWTQARGFSERAAGPQTNFAEAWTATGRLRLARQWDASVSGALSTDRLRNDAFEDARTYDIRTVEVEPELGYQPARWLRLTASGVYARKRDRFQGRRARVIRTPVRARLTQAGRFQVTARGEVADVALDGDAVGLAQFELTDGRGPGTSYLWGASGQYAFNRTLRATFAYDGRKPANLAVINTFRVQLSANF